MFTKQKVESIDCVYRYMYTHTHAEWQRHTMAKISFEALAHTVVELSTVIF